MEISVWGARGSIPACGPNTVEIGGNTSCVMVRTDERAIILDAGSGIVPLGQRLKADGVREIDIFLTHFHYDHVMGIPFFAPLFKPDVTVTIWSAGAACGGDTEKMVREMMRQPFFPVCIDVFAATLHCKTFERGDDITGFGDLSIATTSLHHPGGSTGYRLSKEGRSFCYVTDFEHDNGPHDKGIVKFVKDADLAFLDSGCTPDDYACQKGFGHSHWQACGAICDSANVKAWRLFHHHHLRTDDELLAIEKAAQDAFPNCAVAREGEVFELGPGA